MKRSILTLLFLMSLFGSSLGVRSPKADSCPGSITVMNAGDNDVGSLRQAIADLCPEGTIVFDASLSGQTITLDSTLIIDKGLTVDGSTLESKISIDGKENLPVFEVSSEAVTTLDSLIIKNGRSIDPGFGGGILNTGSLHITRSIVTHNSGIEGGGIRNMGVLNITDSVVSDNSAVDLGGGILNYGYLTVIGTAFTRNLAGTGGGIYDDYGTVDVDDSVFSENAAVGSGTGGGISISSGILHVSNSTFSGNSADSGGGIYVHFSGLLDISSSTFTNNSAVVGGGVSTYANLAAVLNSTFSGNSASSGGGIYNGSALNVFNSTFFNNDAVQFGGGIHNPIHLTLSVTNSTFSNNSAALGGAISNLGDLQYANTILANSTSGDDCYSPSLAGARVDLNLHNIVEKNADASNQCGVPLLSADPRLNPLSDNGGSTRTMALLPGSPALGAGDPGSCASESVDNLDQRGVTRPQGDMNCDIGAYESSLLTDLTPPDPPLVTIPPAHTNDTTPGIGGVAEPASRVDVWYFEDPDNPTQICQDISVDEAGHWSCTSLINLPEGNIELTARATDEAGNQSAGTAYAFHLDLELPTVVSLLPAHSIPTVEDTLEFQVIYSEPVTNLSADDFTLDASEHITGAVVDDVNGSGDQYTVTVRRGSGNGMLRLDIPVDARITDLAGNSLRNLPFTGEPHAVEEPASVAVAIYGARKGTYVVDPGTGTRQSYTTINNGPVKIESINSIALMAAERVIYQANGIDTSYTEMMALPGSQLDTTYWLPWYNNRDLDTQLRFANAGHTTATVHVLIGGVEMTGSPLTLLSGESTRRSFSGINAGPVKIMSDVHLVASERIIYKVNGVPASFTEMIALPNGQLDSVYWLPWYNNKDLDTQLRFANVTDQPASVHVFIGGVEMQGSPFRLAAGESIRRSFADINAGPVEIVSDHGVPIVAAERLIYKVNGVNTSFTEMMGLPASQVDTTYWLPWYNNKDLDTQLRFANVHDTQTATVHVYIGGVEMQNSPFTLLPGQSTRQSFVGINNGPVKIVSDVPIVAAERLIYKVNNIATSFSEMMALPDKLLSTSYWLPWYNNVDLDTQLRFGVP
jgi:hypothetical protein